MVAGARVLPDRYSDSRLIGRGGMAEIYLARDTELGRNVVVKVLDSRFADRQDLRRRFKRGKSFLSGLILLALSIICPCKIVMTARHVDRVQGDEGRELPCRGATVFRGQVQFPEPGVKILIQRVDEIQALQGSLSFFQFQRCRLNTPARALNPHPCVT